MSDPTPDQDRAAGRDAQDASGPAPGTGPAADGDGTRPRPDRAQPAAAAADPDVEAVVQEMAADQPERDVADLRAALLEAERLRDEYLEQAQRGRAEYHNLKRRSDEALAVALDRGAERLLTDLLGVIDNIGYLVDAIDDDDATPLAKGVRMVHGELFGKLEAAGLEPIPGVGATFDPQIHEALLSEESDQPLEEPVVAEVLRPGYRFKGRTLRPASVKVTR